MEKFKQPTGNTEESVVADSPGAPMATASLGAYGSNSLYTLDLSKDRWKQEHAQNKGKLINSTPEGRLAIRSFSRGVLGALCFAGGGRYAGAKMASYHPERAPENWLQHAARFFDVAAGRPIEAAVNALGGDGRKAVTFRPTNTYYGGQSGRTLGHDAVMVTFDFAAMSVGDALGRDIASLADPAAYHAWKREDGSIDPSQAVKTLATNAFRYLTYNQGEDWAVALPYVYYLRWQRGVINKFSPGFAYDSDRGLNGGSFKVDHHGRVVGNYQMEGLLDLQGRFTAYNIGTLMFREAYTSVADKYLNWQKDGFALPTLHADDLTPAALAKKAVDHVKDTGAWAARDAIKGTLYMTPSVPFFWLTRSPQTKYRGLYIHPEQGPIGFMRNTQPVKMDLLHVNELTRPDNKQRSEPARFTEQTPLFFSKFNESSGWSTQPLLPPATRPRTDPYAQTFGPVDAVLNSFGAVNNRLRKAAHGPVKWLSGADDPLRLKLFSDTYVNASLAYTPYFWSKTEFANLWDNARMDTAIERALHGVNTLSPAELGAGLNEIGHSLRLEPLPDPAREQKAQARLRNDISAADIFDPKLFQEDQQNPEDSKASAAGAPYLARVEPPNQAGFVERLQLHKQHAQSRMEQFKQQQRPEGFAAQVAPKAAPTPPPAPEPKAAFAEQEALRQLHPAELPGTGTTIH